MRSESKIDEIIIDLTNGYDADDEIAIRVYLN